MPKKTEPIPPEPPSRVFFQCSMPVTCKMTPRNLEKIQDRLLDIAVGFGFDSATIWQTTSAASWWHRRRHAAPLSRRRRRLLS